jgi:pSer/pThr/pTyr-binding forkhead associated (FHA) protein
MQITDVLTVLFSCVLEMPIFEIYDDRTPRRILVDTQRITIGRTADNQIFVDERQASRKHCEVYLSEEGYFLRDLCSRNGTFLNQDRVEKAELLRDGDEIGIGKSTIRFWKNTDKVDESTVKLPLYDLNKIKKSGEQNEKKPKGK